MFRTTLFCLGLALSASLFAEGQIEQTLSLIKPDAVEANHVGDIIAKFEKDNLRIAALKMVKLTKKQAEEFYSVHQGKAFFDTLTDYMSSGPLVAIVLEGKDSVAKNRKIMGATDPQKAESETIRALFASSITKNAVHGSDSLENAKKEIPFFFAPSEVYSRW
ncbi:Nucleoside diphosphate kinase 1 [Chlamydiales bacterium STE3]|nr:Nucleoside diphosphate kinase 1 [Chlamydiales bacterium STE3]